MIRARWHQLAQGFLRFSLRERLLLMFAVCGLLLFVFWWLAWRPLVLQLRAEQQRQNQLQEQIAALQGEQVALQNQIAVQQQQGEDARLQTQRTQLQQAISTLNDSMVKPEDMARLLTALLPADGRLQLLALEKLPAETPPDAANADAAASATAISNNANNNLNNTTAANPATPAGLYRHRLKLVLRGRYADAHAYLQALENLPWKLWWEVLDYQVETHPDARITLELATLGRGPEWLGG